MIKDQVRIGLGLSEKDYRALPEPSYSLLSSIAKHGPDAIHGKREDIQDKDGVVIGSIADSKITEHKEPDNMVVINKKPSNKALAVIKDLASSYDLKDVNNPVSVKNKDEILKMCDKHDYYKSKNADFKVNALKKYTKYAKTLASNNSDIMIVSDYQYKEACEITKSVFNKYQFLIHEKENIIPQVQLIEEINGIDIKCMLDFIYINWKNKVIVPFDLKTGYGPHHEFFDMGYLGWGYYIQGSLYRKILMEHLSKLEQFKDFKVENFRFLYCGRSDKLPVIFKVTDKQHNAGFSGFEYGGIRYPGIDELIEDYKFYKSRPNNFYRRGYEGKEIVFNDSYL